MNEIKLLSSEGELTLTPPPRYRLPAAGRRDDSPVPGPDGGQAQPLHVRLRGLPVRRGPRALPDGGRPPGHRHHAGLQLRPEDPPHPHGGQHCGGRRGPSEERLRGEAGDGAGLLRGEHRRPPSSSAGVKLLQVRTEVWLRDGLAAVILRDFGWPITCQAALSSKKGIFFIKINMFKIIYNKVTTKQLAAE